MQPQMFRDTSGREQPILRGRIGPGHAETVVQTVSASTDRGQRLTWRARSACHGQVRRRPVALATGVPPQTSPNGRCNGTRQPAAILHFAPEEAPK